MSDIENYDGLCGVIANFATSDLQLRCKHEFGHHGPHSFEKYETHFRCWAGSFSRPDPERGFIESVLFHKK